MENREGVASIPLAAGRWDFGRFLGVGSLEKRERSLEGKMQTVNSKKKKEKEKLRRYIATLWLGLSRGPERRSLRNFCYLDAFLVEWCGDQSLD